MTSVPGAVPAPLPGPEPTAVLAPPVAATPLGMLDAPIFFDRTPAEAFRAQWRSRVVSRGVGLLISGVIWGVLWWISKDDLWPGFWWFLGISLGINGALLLWALVRMVLAGRELRRLHDGLALGIGRDGLFIDRAIGWQQVTSLTTKRPGLRGSVRLVIMSQAGDSTLPIEWLSADPASIDNAVRTLSARRHHIDLRAFG